MKKGHKDCIACKGSGHIYGVLHSNVFQQKWSCPSCRPPLRPLMEIDLSEIVKKIRKLQRRNEMAIPFIHAWVNMSVFHKRKFRKSILAFGNSFKNGKRKFDFNSHDLKIELSCYVQAKGLDLSRPQLFVSKNGKRTWKIGDDYFTEKPVEIDFNFYTPDLDLPF